MIPCQESSVYYLSQTPWRVIFFFCWVLDYLGKITWAREVFVWNLVIMDMSHFPLLLEWILILACSIYLGWTCWVFNVKHKSFTNTLYISKNQTLNSMFLIVRSGWHLCSVFSLQSHTHAVHGSAKNFGESLYTYLETHCSDSFISAVSSLDLQPFC